MYNLQRAIQLYTEVRPTAMRRPAFISLQSVLLVTACFAALALLTSFDINTVRGSAQRLSCQSNLQQIRLAVEMYSDDYSDRLPVAMIGGSPDWADSVLPYLHSVTLFRCPMVQPSSVSSGSVPTYTSNDYFLNANLSAAHRNAFHKPADLIMIGDGTPNYPTLLPTIGSNPKTMNSYLPNRRHLGGANYLFADGHVKWHSPETLKAPLTWNPE